MAYDDSAANRIHRAETFSPLDRASTVQQPPPATATAPQATIDLGVILRLVRSADVTVDMGSSCAGASGLVGNLRPGLYTASAGWLSADGPSARAVTTPARAVTTADGLPPSRSCRLLAQPCPSGAGSRGQSAAPVRLDSEVRSAHRRTQSPPPLRGAAQGHNRPSIRLRTGAARQSARPASRP